MRIMLAYVFIRQISVLTSVLPVNFNVFVFTVTFWESAFSVLRAEKGAKDY